MKCFFERNPTLKKALRCGVVVASLFSLAACVPAKEVTRKTPIYTPSPAATKKPTPTYTLVPTATHTPEPTYTPSPTATPIPTATPVPRVEIIGLSWQPVRVVNDKVYDGKVVFEAEGDKVLGYAELKFIPKEYLHLPRPEEGPRRFVLEPLDGVFDELKEEFAVDITDIVGGREYEVEAMVKDRDGNVATASLITPYIRQFENLGKSLYEKGVIIGAIYRPYHLHEFPKSWHTRLTPLISYNWSEIDIIISRHIDWATGHGINVFIHDWCGPYTRENSMIKRFTNNPLADNIKMAIDIEVQWRFIGRSLPDKPPEWKYYDFDDPVNKRTLLTDVDYLLDAYMIHDQYLKVKNKPLLFFWDSKSFIGDFPSAFNEANKLAKDRDFNGIFFYGCEIGWILADPEWDKQILERAKYFDAISIWAAGYSGESTDLGDKIRSQHAKLLEELYGKWADALRSLTALVPSVIPGFDNRKAPWGNPNDVPLLRDKERFKMELETALKYMDGKLKMIRIDTWNDWYENTQLEPSIEEGFLFLSVLKRVINENL